MQSDEKRSFADTRRRRQFSRPTRRREPASENYDGNPHRLGILDAVLLGYARVSTADQNPDHQVDALRRAGVAK